MLGNLISPGALFRRFTVFSIKQAKTHFVTFLAILNHGKLQTNLTQNCVGVFTLNKNILTGIEIRFILYYLVKKKIHLSFPKIAQLTLKQKAFF